MTGKRYVLDLDLNQMRILIKALSVLVKSYDNDACDATNALIDKVIADFRYTPDNSDPIELMCALYDEIICDVS
jgi:hypothetical protein